MTPADASAQTRTSEQAEQIIGAARLQDAMWGTLVRLVMVTGLRRGELALRWSDFDLAAAQVDGRHVGISYEPACDL